MTTNDFEEVVKQTIAELPEEFKSQLDNVEIVIEDWPEDIPDDLPTNLLGLYHGIPKTERYSYSALPDKITIYKEPLLRISGEKEEIIKHIKQTVLHELGHHFGLSDEELTKIEHK